MSRYCIAVLQCDSCGATISRATEPARAADQVVGLECLGIDFGWVRSNLIPDQGPRDYCGDCIRNLPIGELDAKAQADAQADALPPPRPFSIIRHAPMFRSGFTLVELLVVMAIVGIIFVVAAPVVMTSLESRRVDSAAAIVQGEVAAARARAERDGSAGIRLLPDATFLTRRPDGSIDPDSVLAFDRVVPLAAQPGYSAGLVAIHASYPAGFAPLPGRLVLEQEVRTGGLYNEPTSWAWNVRLGDQVEVLGRRYTVCGPIFAGPAEGNVEMFVNYGPGGPGLDRGDGPAEWLYLVNGLDDDGDGRPDNGWNGVDDDADGVVDGPNEWTETEAWGRPGAALRDGAYTIRRRPAAPAAGGGVVLAGAAIDATGWAGARDRSRLPVDPWTGAVDLVIDAGGRVSPARIVGTPAADGLRNRWHHLWLANREDLAAPAAASSTGRLLAIDAKTSRTVVVEAQGSDPAAARRAAEGGGL